MSPIASKKSSPTYPDVIFDYFLIIFVKSISKSFNAFHFGFAAVPMILKIDQAISDSFSAYCQIVVHMLY
jgi:hypothetical protein